MSIKDLQLPLSDVRNLEKLVSSTQKTEVDQLIKICSRMKLGVLMRSQCVSITERQQ